MLLYALAVVRSRDTKGTSGLVKNWEERDSARDSVFGSPYNLGYPIIAILLLQVDSVRCFCCPGFVVRTDQHYQ